MTNAAYAGFERETRSEEGAEALTRGAMKFARSGGCRFVPDLLAHAFATEVRADAAMKIVNGGSRAPGRLRVVEEQLQFRHAGIQNRCLLRQDAASLGSGNDKKRVEAGLSFEAVVPAAQLGQGANTEVGEASADFFGESAKIGDDHFRLAFEAHSERFVLRGDANRTGVQVTLARHDAADGNERGGPEIKFVGAQDRSHQNVTGKAHAAVDTQTHAGTQSGAQ